MRTAVAPAGAGLSKYAQARLAVVGANMVNRSVGLLIRSALSDVARALVTVEANMKGTRAGNKAIAHYASAVGHLRAAVADVDIAKEEVKKALGQIHTL